MGFNLVTTKLSKQTDNFDDIFEKNGIREKYLKENCFLVDDVQFSLKF